MGAVPAVGARSPVAHQRPDQIRSQLRCGRTPRGLQAAGGFHAQSLRTQLAAGVPLPRGAMSGPAIRIGFFGKLPSRGDFVRMYLSRAIVTAWDQWLQSVMPEAQAHLSE